MNWIVCVDRDEQGRAIHCLEQWLSTGEARHGVGYGITHSHIHCIPLNASIITLIIIIIFIYCNWVVTRWQWLFYVYTKHKIGY